MRAFKGFNKDLTCRGYQYEEGKEFHTERAECCDTGFHACEYPLDCFGYYEIQQEYKDAGGCFPEIVQVYLWCECKEYGVDYYTVLALIERESGYHWDKVGDNGNSKGYMQIYEKWHTERMEAEGVTDLFNPYQNIRVGLNCLREIQDKYLASSGENCVLMVYNMGESGAKKLWAKDIYSSAYSREVISRAQELRQELAQE